MRWVEVAEVGAGVAVAPAEAADVGQDGWVALLPPVQEATVSVLAAGNASHTWQVNPATRKNARNAASR